MEARAFTRPNKYRDGKHSLHPRREAGDWEEEPVGVEVLEHALDGLPVDAEGDAGRAEVQAAADHVVRSEEVLVGRAHRPRDAAWR